MKHVDLMSLLTRSQGLAGCSVALLVSLAGAQDCTNGSYLDGSFIALGESYKYVDLGDLNGDGFLDLIAAEYSVGGTLGVHLGNGDGSFGESIKFELEYQPKVIKLVDLDGDGVLDLVIGSDSDPKLFVYAGLGDGGFAARQEYVLGESGQVYDFEWGDFNNDGDLDVMVSGEFSSGGPMVLLGLGGGVFAEPYAVGSGVSSGYVELGDLNGDKNLDAVLGDRGHVSEVLLGSGDGLFTSDQQTPGTEARTSSRRLLLGDIDHDGHLDALSFFLTPFVFIQRGHGDGTFSASGEFVRSRFTRHSQLVDMDGDGRLDIAFVGVSNGGVLWGRGDGSFRAIEYELQQEGDGQALSSGNAHVAVGDLDNDGDLDMVVTLPANEGVSVLLQRCSPGCPSDLNGDGRYTMIDVNILHSAFVLQSSEGDLNGDGVLNYYDISAFLQAAAAGCP